MTTKTARPFGRSLEDLWLKEGGVSDPQGRYTKECRLFEAEWELLRCAATGEWCDRGTVRPESGNSKNMIRSDLLRFISLGGDETSPLHESGIKLANSFIEGEVDFTGSVVPENFHLQSCTISDDIVLIDTIAEMFSLEGCSVQAVSGDRMESSANVRMNNGFIANGRVNFCGAKIAGDFECTGGHFYGAETSIKAERAEIAGTVFLNDGFVSLGKVSITEAKIGTDITCRGGQFLCKDQSLVLRNSAIGGDIRLSSDDNSVSTRFAGSISLKRTTTGGDVIFNATSFETIGQVNLNNAKIAGQLIWRDLVQRQTAEETAPDEQNETLWFNRVWPPILPKRSDMAAVNGAPKPLVGELNLAGASCQTISMDEASWHMPGVVRIDHFTYDGFSQLNEDWNAKRWVNWLERQPDKHLTKRFRPHPYQQLAKVLQSSGFEEEARSIRMERKERQRIFANHYEPRNTGFLPSLFYWLNRFWRFAQKHVVGHGYRPGVAVFWLLGMILLGTGIYQKAAWDGIITPAHPLIFKEAIWHGELDETPPGKIPAACRENWVYPPAAISARCAASVPSEYSTFSALVYSLDVAVPVVNFRMESDWAPRVVHWQTGEHDWYGWSVRLWEWIQIGLGWAFSLLFVSAISGVIRRD